MFNKKAIDAYQCLLVNGRRLYGYDYILKGQYRETVFLLIR
jgi:hypothetical protein